MEPSKPDKIPRPENDLPKSEKPVVRPTLERVISSRVDSRRSSVAFDNAVLMNMGEGMYTVDLNGSVTSMNRTAEILLGWTYEELAGRNMHSATHYLHRDGTLFPAEECAEFQVLQDGQSLKDHDDFFIRKDGSFFDVIYSASPLREDGEIKGVVVIFRDVTERNETLRALRDSEERFRDLADNISQLAWMTDADGWIFWYNQRWYDYTGTTLEQMQGWGWQAVHHPDHVERVTGHFKKFIDSGEAWEDSFPLRSQTGEYRWFLSRAQPIRDESGKIVRWFGTNTDITDKKNIEERIRLRETQLRVITNSVPGLISYIDRDCRYRFVNHQYTEWFGIPESEIIGKKMHDLLGVKTYKILKPKVEQVLAGEACSIETLIHYPKAGTRFVQFSYTPDVAEDGLVIGFYVLVTDLTERKLAEDQLRNSEERMRVLMWSLTEHAVLSIDNEGKIDAWNRGAQLLFGYEKDEIIARPVESLFTPEDVARGVHLKEMRLSRQKGHAADDRWHIRKDGSRFFASGEMTPVYVGKTLIGYAKIVRDLTEAKRLADDLQRSHDELETRVAERTKDLAEANALLLRQMDERAFAEEQRLELLRRLFTVQEDERARIARDIHDQLGQRLTALRLKIASLKEMSNHEPAVELRINRLQEIAELLDSEVSFLAWELRPNILENVDFVKALENYVSEWSRHSEIFAEFDAVGVRDVQINADLEINLYRITQEALNNAAKHAKADQINVLLEKRDNQLILIIEDNGVGFDTTVVNDGRDKGKGFGLFGMRERAALISAVIEIESAKNNGTSIFVRVPLAPAIAK